MKLPHDQEAAKQAILDAAALITARAQNLSVDRRDERRLALWVIAGAPEPPSPTCNGFTWAAMVWRFAQIHPDSYVACWDLATASVDSDETLACGLAKLLASDLHRVNSPGRRLLEHAGGIASAIKGSLFVELLKDRGIL